MLAAPCCHHDVAAQLRSSVRGGSVPAIAWSSAARSRARAWIRSFEPFIASWKRGFSMSYRLSARSQRCRMGWIPPPPTAITVQPTMMASTA